jgi:hypothetical protein
MDSTFNRNLEEQIKEATHKSIMIHEVLDSGSAFAETANGELVFINQRIVSTMRAEAGQTYEAFLLPNYPDKREMIPWRALRLATEGQDPTPKKQPVDEKLLHAIVRLLNNEGYLTAAEIAETLDVSLIDVHRALGGGHGIVMSVPAYFIP